MADSFYVSGLRGKSDVFTPGGTGSMTSGDDYSRSGTEFYPVVTANDGDDGSAIDNLNTRGTEAPAGSAIQPSINDSVAVELMLEDKEVIIDTRGRVELPDIDDLDFINSSVKPNPYAYATSYYTTFYVRNYSYNWNDNSYLSVDINGKVTDIYANSYGTVRMDYYPTDITPAESIGSLTFNVDVENTNKYKTLEPGNYIVWENSTATPVVNQPYCVDGLLYIPGENDQHHNLTYATVSKNARIIVDSDVSNADISAVQKWWSSAYFTYVANIWQQWVIDDDTKLTGSNLVTVTYTDNIYTYTAIQGASISLNNIPDTSNKFFLICGNFGVGDEIVRYSTTFIIPPKLSSNNTLESPGRIKFEDETFITSSATIEFEEGKLVTITIIPDVHYTLNTVELTSFKRNGSTFSPNINDGESITPDNGNYIVKFKVNSAATYEVMFDKRTYTINVSGTGNNGAIENGTFIISGIGSNSSVEYGKTITLNAIANYGYHFDQWSNDWLIANQFDGNNPLTIEVNDNIITNNSVNIILSFVQNPPDTHNVNVELHNNNGQSRAYAAPTYVPNGDSCTLYAYPGEEDDFDKWQKKIGNNTWSDLEFATDNPYVLNNITVDTTVRAVFKLKTYTVTININTLPDSVGVGGRVIDSNNNELQNGNSIPVEYDSNITLQAITNNGFVFNGWSGSVVNLGNELQINNIKENKTVTANFVKTYTITVVAEPETAGTVTGGGTYIYGFNTEISAVPISSEYRFDHWSDNGAQTHNVDVIGNATYTAYFVPNTGDDENADTTDEEEEWPGDEYYDNEEENEAELRLNNISADIFINYIKPRVAIVSGNQLERIHGEFLPIFCLPNNYNSMTTSELSEMYNNSTYMICHTTVSSENDGNTVFCNIVKSTNNISINLCDNYEEYCTYKYNDGKNRYVILDDDINSLHSYTYNYVTTAFQATGDPNTICHTAAYINIYDNVVTQEFRNDGKYSVIDAMSRKNSTYMMYVSFNIDPYYDAKVLGGKNMTYTSVSLFRCSNYGLSDNSNVTLFHSENMPNVTGLQNGIFNEDSKRGAFVFMIDNETNHNIDTTYNPSTFDNNTDIILHSDLFFNPSIVENANDKTFIESIILANPMCTISYTDTDKIKTAYFVNGDEYSTELLWYKPIDKVNIELYSSYIVNYNTSYKISYQFVDEFTTSNIDGTVTISKDNDIYTLNFNNTNILNNLDINFKYDQTINNETIETDIIEEKKYKCERFECAYNTVTLIADVPSKTPITASVIVKQEIPKFKLNNDWPQEPTP